MKSIVIGAAALASLVATSATAQTTAPVNPGPAIPGVCVFFNQQVLAQSAAGQAVQARMQQLVAEVDGELQPFSTTLQTEAQALQAGAATIPAADLQARRTALQQRAQEAQQLEQTRTAELRYTQAAQRERIAQALEPLLTTIYQERGCGILLDRESVFMMNPAMDVTPLAIERLNAALPTLTFNRMAVPVQVPQGQ